MKAAALDFNQPETAKGVGGELAAVTEGLVERLGGAVAVTDIASLEQAVMDRQQIGDTVKRVEEFFQPFTQMADKLHKALVARKNAILGPLLRLDAEKRAAISAFKVEEDRRREQREREIAETRRRDAEARAIAEGAALEAVGEHALAAAVVAQAVAEPDPVVVLKDEVRAVAKFRRSWKWRLKNEALVERQFLCLDTKKLDKYATAMQQSAKTPGIEFFFVDDPVR